MAEQEPRLEVPTSYSEEWRTRQYNTETGPGKIAARQNYYSLRGLERRGQPLFDIEITTIKALYAAGLNSTDTVVDVGCAYPFFMMQMGLHGHAGPLIGVEPNTAQFNGLPYWQSLESADSARGANLKDWRDLARQILRPVIPDYPNIHLLEASAGNIPLEDGYADAATSMFMFYHIDKAHQSQTLTEFKRIIKPGGLFALTTRGSHNKEELCKEEVKIAQALTTIMKQEVSPPAPTNSGFTSEDALKLLPEHFRHTYQLHHRDTIVIDDDWAADMVIFNHLSLADLYLTADKQAPTLVQFMRALTEAVLPRMDSVAHGRHIMYDTLDESLFICSDRALDLPAGFTEVQ